MWDRLDLVLLIMSCGGGNGPWGPQAGGGQYFVNLSCNTQLLGLLRLGEGEYPVYTVSDGTQRWKSRMPRVGRGQGRFRGGSLLHINVRAGAQARRATIYNA